MTTHLQGPPVAAACPYDLGEVVARVATSHLQASTLRRECAALLDAHVTGTATPAMRRRYVRNRMALVLHAMPRRLPALPAGTAAIVRRNEEFVLELLVGYFGDVD
ncbi:MAG: hypothetical protein ACT4O0_03145 [Pseudonocardia sp.]